MNTDRKTKIIATIGPATLDYEIFEAVIKEGVDIIRINTSHGSYDQYDGIIANARKLNSKSLKILFDIKKIEEMDYFAKNNLDILAISFAETIDQIREYKNKAGQATIIAKIETEKGIENLESFIEETDGVMIARGDLSKAVSLEKIASIQKDLTRITLQYNKMLIVATEMMLSMVNREKPEVAEVSDVSNAVFDGAHVVMLSEETAIGKYPAETVGFMKRTVEEAEKWANKNLNQ